MKFNDFININGFDASSTEKFTDAMKHFIMNPRLKPFTQAVMATASDENKKEFKVLLMSYWETLNQAQVFWTADYWNNILSAPKDIGNYTPDEINEFKIQFEQENSRLPNSDLEAFDYCMSKILKTFSESSKVMRNLLYPQASREPQCIQRERDISERFIQIGMGIILEEVARAITQSLDHLKQHDHLVNFNEFCKFAWQESRKDYFEPSVFHFLGYLYFVQSIVSQFDSDLLGNESTKKAKKFQRLFDVIHSKLMSSYQAYGKLMLQISDNEAILGITDRISHLVPPKHAPDGHNDVEGCLARERPEHSELSKEQFSAYANLKKLDETLSSYTISFDEMGRFDTQDQDIKRMYDNISYWLTEIPRVLARNLQLDNFINFEPNRNSTDKLYRRVTQAELDDIRKYKQFRQGPRSYEREKWFFYNKGEPSVDHPFVCVIHTDVGAIDLLKAIAQPAGSYAVVVNKEAERDCVGIHEDGLQYLNRMVHKVEVYQSSISPANRRETISFEPKQEPIKRLNLDIATNGILESFQNFFVVELFERINTRSVYNPIVSQIVDFHTKMQATDDYYNYLRENFQQISLILESANTLANTMILSAHFDIVIKSLKSLINIIRSELLTSDDNNERDGIGILATDDNNDRVNIELLTTDDDNESEDIELVTEDVGPAFKF